MDEHTNDPYEQQLYAVFQSCLTKEETELDEDQWLVLCHKLHLAEESDELKSLIQKHEPEKRSISFKEFRAALLALLGKTEELVADREELTAERNFLIDSHQNIYPSKLDSKSCNLIPISNENSDASAVNLRSDADENKLKRLWETVNVCLKGNVDSTTMYFISNCLGIPALPKQITQCIFEKLDQNCDGLISFDEFVIIFQSKKTLQEQLAASKDESLKSLEEPDSEEHGFDVVPHRKISFTRSSTFLDMWKVAGITNSSLLANENLKDASDVCLADLTTTLCDELKNLDESLDHSGIRSHITLLRDILILYQEKLHSLHLTIENINREKEKLRIDVIEANDRANSLAQEIDDQNARHEGITQNLRKQIEQRHAETVQDLSNQLSSERESNAAALKSKDNHIQTIQKESFEIRNKFVNALQDNQLLETENEQLGQQIQKLKLSNNELVQQMKMLAAEHDQEQNVEVKKQEEVIFLVDRIKQLQSDAVLLRDQNDELTAEIEILRLRNSLANRDNNMPAGYAAKNIQLDESEDREACVIEEEPELNIFFKHSTLLPPAISNETEKSKKTDLKELLAKRLNNLLTNNEKSNCSLENCVFRCEISALVNRLQSDSHLLKDAGFAQSIASEIDAECEERTTESLRDFVVPKHKSSVIAKRATAANGSEDEHFCDIDDGQVNSGQETKGPSQNKIPSLRDYPPRKEEQQPQSSVDSQLKIIKEKESSLNDCSTVKSLANEISVKTRNYPTSDSIDDINRVNVLRELELSHAAEKKQLTERCLVLERSLELLKTEYEECEDYWAAKLEEERQLFEQEQKISDDKFSDLIAKMAEYEQLISPVEKTINGGRLSPIEEKFHLEQQYLDLEEEFERWKAQVEKETLQKDQEISELSKHLKSIKRPTMINISVQVTEENIFSHLIRRPNYYDVPTSSLNIFSSTERAYSCKDNMPDLSEEFQMDKILESNLLSSDPIKNAKKTVTDCKRRNEPSGFDCKIGGNSTSSSNSTATATKAENPEYQLIRNNCCLRSQNRKSANCRRNIAQSQVCCVDVDILQNLNMRLKIQERKKHQLQLYFKQQQNRTEHVLHRIMSQHQIEVSTLQCLLRNTQKKLQVQVETNVEQSERLAKADVLVKDLYIENAYLLANVKRLEQHCLVLTGFESTSI